MLIHIYILVQTIKNAEFETLLTLILPAEVIDDSHFSLVKCSEKSLILALQKKLGSSSHIFRFFHIVT
jgi:hypothetical protein